MSRGLFRITLLAAGLQLLALAGAAAAAQPAEKEVRDRRAAFVKAINARDPEAVAKFIAEDVTVAVGDKTLTGAAAREALLKITTLPPGISLTGKVEKVTLKGDSAVLEVADTATFTDADGKKQTETGRSKETWKKVGGQWLLARNE